MLGASQQTRLCYAQRTTTWLYVEGTSAAAKNLGPSFSKTMDDLCFKIYDIPYFIDYISGLKYIPGTIISWASSSFQINNSSNIFEDIQYWKLGGH